jgi:hypothetical protein
VAPSKITDFAGEGAAADAAVLGDYGQAKCTAILAAMVHAAQEKARDDTAEVFCRRVATSRRPALRARHPQTQLLGPAGRHAAAS